LNNDSAVDVLYEQLAAFSISSAVLSGSSSQSKRILDDITLGYRGVDNEVIAVHSL